LIDQKKKDCEKDVGRVEVILPAVDQKKKDCEKDNIGRVEMIYIACSWSEEERLWERYWKSGNDGGAKFKDKESSF
jgi:hypothetical protein